MPLAPSGTLCALGRDGPRWPPWLLADEAKLALGVACYSVLYFLELAPIQERLVDVHRSEATSYARYVTCGVFSLCSLLLVERTLATWSMALDAHI